MRTLLNHLNNFADLLRTYIPPGYRLPLVVMAGLVGLLLLAIVMVSPPTAPVALESMQPAPIKQGDPTDPIIELFNPSAAQTAAQQHESATIEQIDNILLNSYLLTKCKKMKPDEYSDTWQMLVLYARVQKLASNMQEADALVRKRAAAASGSFQMVYGRLKCGDVDSERLAYQLDIWRRHTRLSPIKKLN